MEGTMRYEPVHKCVWVVRLPRISYAVRLLIYRCEEELRAEHGDSWDAYLYGVFCWSPKGRRLGNAHWLGAIAVALDTADCDTLVHELCHVAQRMQRAGHTQEVCAHACGRLAAAVLEECRRLGIEVRPSNSTPTDIQRYDDAWDPCRRNWLLRLFPDDPELEAGDALD